MSVTLEVDHDETFGRLPDGRPDPLYAAAVGLVAASASKRSFAFLIDAAILTLVSLPIVVGALPIWLGPLLQGDASDIPSLVASPAFASGLIFWAVGQGLASILILVQLIMHGLKGVTVGKVITGLRSINVATYRKPGFWRIVLRAIVFYASGTIIPVAGAVVFLLSPLWDREKRGRGWLDRVGRNWLIDARRGLDPSDVKALRHARKQAEAPARAQEQEHPSLATDSSGAVTPFVPAARSSSAVIGARSLDDAPVAAWRTPVIADAPVASASGRSDSPAVRVAVVPEQRQVTLVFDDGSRIGIARPTLIGRNPAPQPGEEDHHLVPVTDPSTEISKSHASLGLDGDGVWICDRGSSNGTSVVTPAGEATELVPWERTRLSDRSRVQLGGRSFTVAIDNPDAQDIA